MKRFVLLALVLTLFAFAAHPVLAPTGTIRIDPTWPVMQDVVADFEIWVEGAGEETHDPHVLLVMTEDCYNGLGGDNVVISWTHDGGGSVEFGQDNSAPNWESDFTPVTGAGGVCVPPSGTTEGACYTVAALKDHLDYDLGYDLLPEDTIYWAMGPFVVDPLTNDPQEFTSTLPSSDPRMLIYALGKTEAKSERFDNYFDAKVPPTRPGFQVPELAPALLALASFSALALYALKRRKYIH